MCTAPVLSFEIKTNFTEAYPRTNPSPNKLQKASSEEDNDLKDSCTHHFILRSVDSTEHEITQNLLSGRVSFGVVLFPSACVRPP